MPRQTLWTGVSRRTPGPDLACEVLCGDGEHKFARALPHFAEKILFMSERVARVEPRWEDGIFLGVSDRSDELHVGTERGMHKVRTVRRREATERVAHVPDSVSARPRDGPKKVRDVRIVLPETWTD